MDRKYFFNGESVVSSTFFLNALALSNGAFSKHLCSSLLDILGKFPPDGGLFSERHHLEVRLKQCP